MNAIDLVRGADTVSASLGGASRVIPILDQAQVIGLSAKEMLDPNFEYIDRQWLEEAGIFTSADGLSVGPYAPTLPANPSVGLQVFAGATFGAGVGAVVGSAVAAIDVCFDSGATNTPTQTIGQYTLGGAILGGTVSLIKALK